MRQTLVAVLLAVVIATSAVSMGAALGVSTARNSTVTEADSTSTDTDWPAPRADPGRTGVTSDSGPQPYGNLSWSAGEEGRYSREPVVTGGSAYMAYDGIDYPNGIVKSYNTSTGDVQWTQTNVGEPRHRPSGDYGVPTVADGRVFVATHSNYLDQFSSYENRTGLYALNATTGEIDWRMNASVSAPVVADGQVFTSRPQGTTVMAVDPATGERLWTADVNGKVIAYANGTLYATNEATDTLYALSPSDGSVKWQTTVNEDVNLEVTVGQAERIAATDDAVYLTSGKNDDDQKKVIAYDADNGAKLWSTTVSADLNGQIRPPDVVTAPAVTNGTVYVTTQRPVVGTLHALDAETGETEWRFRTKARLRSNPAVANGTVYVGGQYGWNSDWSQERDEYPEVREMDDGKAFLVAFAVDADTGTEQWNLMTTVVEQEGPYATAVADGQLYLTTHNEGLPGSVNLHAIEATDDRPPWYYRVLDDELKGTDRDDRPTDPDGDGKFEDVNGDGEFDIVDVQALFANRNDPMIQDNPEKFDFNGDGKFDIVDVQALFTELTEEN